MKVITEAILRNELRLSEPETYVIPEGKILSPAAREYLSQRKIKITTSKEAVAKEIKEAVLEETEVSSAAKEKQEEFKPKFIDYETDAYYLEKPEYMTQLYDNVLVSKNHKRILFRGKLDSLQSLIVLDQAILEESDGNKKVITDLTGILDILREMMRCDVLNIEFKSEFIIGMSHAKLRECSHDPMKYFNIKQMTLPDYTMGKTYAILNQLRTAVRETEVAAVEAFYEGKKCIRKDIIEELNRMSSAFHIMMCKYLAGEYKV